MPSLTTIRCGRSAGGARGGHFRREAALAQPRLGSLQRALEAIGAEWLQQVIDRMRVEGAHRVLVVGGDENDGGTGLDQLQHFEAVELRHLDVEEEQVR